MHPCSNLELLREKIKQWAEKVNDNLDGNIQMEANPKDAGTAATIKTNFVPMRTVIGMLLLLPMSRLAHSKPPKRFHTCTAV